MIALAHIAGIPVEELLALVPGAGALLLARLGARRHNAH